MTQVKHQLVKIQQYEVDNETKINEQKTKLMLFNTSKTNDFHPEMKIDGVRIEVVEQMKLLGVIITNALKWHENTMFITKKSFGRLRNMGGQPNGMKIPCSSQRSHFGD